MPPPETGNQPLVQAKLDTEAGSVATIVKQHIRPRKMHVTVDDNGIERSILILPAGLQAHSLKKFEEEYATAPERRKGTATMIDLDSFIAHTIRFADKDSAIFATPKPPAMTAVLDYHRIGAEGAPRFGQHRSTYAFPLSDEWEAWSKTRTLSVADFAEFIERRIIDVLDPGTIGDSAKFLAASIGVSFASPSKMLELSRGLAVRVGQQVHNAVNLSTGEAQIRFVEEHKGEGGAPLAVPGAFVVGVPVFRNGAPYQLVVRLRYRVKDQQVTWILEPHRAEVIFDHAFAEACARVRSETGLPLYMGAPEV